MKNNPFIYIIFLILSCTPILHQLKVNDNFKFNEIVKNTIYISPIINKTERNELNYCDNIIYQNFRAERPYYKKLFDTGLIRDMVSENNDFSDTYKLIYDLYTGDKFIDPSLITRLGKHLEPGFIIISKIDSYETRKEIRRGSLEDDVDDHYLITTINGEFTVFNFQIGRIEFHTKHILESSEKKSVHTNCLDPVPYISSLFMNSEFSDKPDEIVYMFYRDILKNFPKK